MPESCKERCTKFTECCRKTFLFLAFAVNTVGAAAYYVLFAYIFVVCNGFSEGSSSKFWFIAALYIWFFGICFCLVPLFVGQFYFCAYSCLITVLLLVMCSFPTLTRQAYYHLSPDSCVSPQLVIMSLQASIIFFVSSFLIEKKFGLQEIFKDKDILTCALVDLFDIFDMVELLSLDQCVGIGSLVTEGSSLEMAIQAFCTMSFAIMFKICNWTDLNETNKTSFGISTDTSEIKETSDGIISQKLIKNLKKISNSVYSCSVIYQNIPFLIIRIIVWAKYGVFRLGFMVKNILAIVACCAEIQRWYQGQGQGKGKCEEEEGQALTSTKDKEIV